MDLSQITNQVHKELKDHLIVFVAKDFSRGIGIEQYLPNYLIVCGTKSDAIQMAREDSINIFCAGEHPGENTKNAGKILESELAQNYIKETAQKLNCTKISIFGFKGSSKIGFVCKKNGWGYLNLSVEKTTELDEKVNFTNLLKEYKGPMLPTFSGKYKDFQLENFESEKYAIQMNRGFAGIDTYFLNKEDLLKLQKEHMENKVKITPFITGETLTLNGCIYQDKIFLSYPFLQKTGLPEYSRHPGGSCGVIFDSLRTQEKTPEGIIGKTIQASQEMAEIFKTHGLKGFFGFDLITDEKEIYPIEINPRLTANIHPFTEQQNFQNLPPFLLLHILEFLNITIDTPNSEEYLHPLQGETLALRNVTDKTFILNEKKTANGYSFAQLLVNPDLKEIFTPNTNGQTIQPDERWAEIWSL